MRPPKILLLVLACLSLATTRCGPDPARGPAGLAILSYNVRNLFDAVADGGEYPEFDPAGGRWTEARYRSRLDRTAEALLAALPEGSYPDILCLVEVEHEGILDDLAAGPLAKGGYAHRAAAKAPGSAVACGVMSRWPILELRSHGLAGEGPAGRPMLEAAVQVGSGELRIFVCHWKSKLGGAAATEPARREAALLLGGRIAELLARDPAAEILVAGDFNENPDEAIRVRGRYPTALVLLGAGGGEALPPGAGRGAAGSAGSGLAISYEADFVRRFSAGPKAVDAPAFGSAGLPLYSPWGGQSGYSYSGESGEERIDGFLLAPGLLDDRGLRFVEFRPVDEAFLLDAEGRPLAYGPSRPGGYSDHLPILLLLESLD